MISHLVNELQRMSVSRLYNCCMANPEAYNVLLNEHINSYDIHDNGGRPFRITVDDQRRRILVSVAAGKALEVPLVGLLPDKKMDQIQCKPIVNCPTTSLCLWAPFASLYYNKIWLGDKTIYPREWTTGALKWAMGNSILLEPCIFTKTSTSRSTSTSTTLPGSTTKQVIAVTAQQPKWLIAIYGAQMTTWQLLEVDEQVERFE